MAVVYRLQGLDGEATEPQITALEEGAPTEDPEVTYRCGHACGDLCLSSCSF